MANWREDSDSNEAVASNEADAPPARASDETVKPGLKRLRRGNVSNRGKKVASSPIVGQEDAEKPNVQKVFTEEEELVLLRGIVAFKIDTEKTPFEDTERFYEFIKKVNLSFEASLGECMEKIKQLKKKYARKWQNNNPCFLKSHDQTCFKFAKFIWGVGGINAIPRRSEPKEVQPDWFEKSFLVRSIESLGVDAVEKRWSLVPEESKKKIEEDLKLLQAKELECEKAEERLKAKKRKCVIKKTNLLLEVIPVITKIDP